MIDLNKVSDIELINRVVAKGPKKTTVCLSVENNKIACFTLYNRTVGEGATIREAIVDYMNQSSTTKKQLA